MSRRAKFSPAEDKDLLAFVEANKRKYPPGGRKLWLFAEANRVTLHSWQAMKSRWQLLTQGPKDKRRKSKTATKDPDTQQQQQTQRQLFFFPHTTTKTTRTATATATTTATATATVTTRQLTLTPTLQGRRHFTDAQTQTDPTDITNRTDSDDWTDWTNWLNWTEEAATQTETPLPRHRRSHSI